MRQTLFIFSLLMIVPGIVLAQVVNAPQRSAFENIACQFGQAYINNEQMQEQLSRLRNQVADLQKQLAETAKKPAENPE